MGIKLDKITFKALSSTTRVDLLKLLEKRRHTQAELSSSLNLAVPTVKQHLELLEQSGLIERHDEGRKWKYFSLTKKAKAVLYPEQTKIWIVLSIFLLAAAGTLFTWPRKLFQAAVETAPVLMMKAESDAVALTPQAVPTVQTLSNAAEISVNTPFPWHFVFLAIVIIALLAVIFLLVKQRRYQKLVKNLTK